MAQSVQFFYRLADAAAYLGIELPAELARVEERYPVLLNSYYLDLIDKAAVPDDPIWKQCMPDPAELADVESSPDPLAEERQSAVPRLIHRFGDRVVLLTTGHCLMRCRFCFRKRTWSDGGELGVISAAEFEAALDYLRQHPEIHEVLLSGGDPLTLPVETLHRMLTALDHLPQIEVIRIGSRVPVTLPSAFSDELLELLRTFESIWLLTHFNHPREVTGEAAALCRRLVRSGIPVLNQTVLLKGVNDSPPVLEELFRRLIALRVKPHYLFHVDPVRGVRHFATGIEAGLAALRYFRPRLSSLAVPAFAIDLPEGGGKVALQPDYSRDGRYPGVDAPDHWIVYPD